MDFGKCPKCGGAIIAEKNTVTGREIRSYGCTQCGWSVDEDTGVALWRAYETARETADAPADVDHQEHDKPLDPPGQVATSSLGQDRIKDRLFGAVVVGCIAGTVAFVFPFCCGAGWKAIAVWAAIGAVFGYNGIKANEIWD